MIETATQQQPQHETPPAGAVSAPPESTRGREAVAELHKLSDKQREEWRLTGKLPERVMKPVEEPRERPAPNLEDMTEKEHHHWRLTGEYPERLTKEAEKTGSTAKAAADEERRPDDRHWTTELTEPERKAHHDQIEKTAGVALEHIQKHVKNAEIERGLGRMFEGKPGQGSDFLKALNEVKNPGAVLEHLGLNEQDRTELLKAGTWQDLRRSVHTISDVLAKRSKPEKKVSDAPPLNKELSGRGAPPPDEVAEALRNNDFRGYMNGANRRDIARSKYER